MTEKMEVITGKIPVGKFDEVCRKYDVQGDKRSEQLRNLILKLLLTPPSDKSNVEPQEGSQLLVTPETMSTVNSTQPPHNEKSIPQTEPFNYQTYEPDCPLATYIMEKKKVHCAWSPKSEKLKEVRSWLPSNRLIDPQVCENCFHGDKFGTYGGYQLWLMRRKEEQGEPKTFSPSYKVNFPFYCGLLNQQYVREEDFTTKHCFACPNEKCPMKVTP